MTSYIVYGVTEAIAGVLAQTPGARMRVTAVRGRRRVQVIRPDGSAALTLWREQMTPEKLQTFTQGRRGW